MQKVSRIFILFLLATLSTAPMSSHADQKVKLLIAKLDAKVITKNLPLTNHKNTLSDSGKAKQTWKIKGQELFHFEVIGNNQSDADNVGWQCKEFDKNGNGISSIPSDSFCHKFFTKALSNVVDRPDYLASSLLIMAGDETTSAIKELDDIAIETDGEFYFIRRISRL